MFLERENEPQFSQPIRQIMLMITILVLVGVGCFFLYPSVAPVFLASPWLNGFILLVFVIGVLTCFMQVLILSSSVSWIEGFALDRPGHEFVKSPRLLTSLAALLRDTRARRALTSTSTRSILDSVATRLDEARDITRYIVNLLIFLGLLGTFYGLATTVPAVVDTIRSLAPADGQEGELGVFDRLMTGLESQLGGMGTAFASSLLGLAGSLVVGVLELFAGHGQNRFYMELENWLSSITRVSIGGDENDAVAIGDEHVAGVLAQTAAQLNSLQVMVSQSEEARIATDERIMQLTDAVTRLSDASISPAGSGASEEVMQRLVAALEARTEADEMTVEARMRLRNIDVQLLRILEEMSSGRQDSVAELRGDLQTLSRTIAALAERV
jgi:hypothetical protein